MRQCRLSKQAKKDRKTTGYLTTSSSNTDRKDTQKSQKKSKGQTFAEETLPGIALLRQRFEGCCIRI